MAYTKQNFENGQILTAEQLNHMEQGIAAPDWNDVTNKPFYDIEPWIPPVTLPEPGADRMKILGHMISPSAADKVCMIKENTKYVVNFNGTDYECESFTHSNFPGTVYLGNIHIVLPIAGDDLPFLLMSNSNLDYEQIEVHLLDENATSCTISFRLADEPTIKHLDPKYIKDMYYETEAEVVLVDNLASTTDEEEWPPCNFIVGDTYKVIWSGVEYKCICYADDRFHVLGGTEGYPFYIDDDGGGYLYIEARDNSDEWTVSVIHVMTEPHRIDPKYLPDSVPYTELVEVLPETVITLSGGEGALPDGFMLAGDTEYEITFNGVSYVCAAVDFSALGGIIFLGNDNLMGNDSGRTEPFCITSPVGAPNSFIIVSDTAAYSCSVSVAQRAVRKIPEKYIPYSSATNGDTLYWDGSMVGREVTGHPTDAGSVIYVKVSDVVLSEEDLVNGVIIRECISGSWVTTEIPGPITYEGGILHFGMLVPSVSLRSGSADAGIYFVITKADFGAGMFEVRAASLTVPGYGKFNSRPTLPAEAMPKYLDGICVDKLILRSPVGKLFSLGISDEGQAQILPVGITN